MFNKRYVDFFPKLASWKICTCVLMVLLLFDCQLLAECAPQTMVKTSRGPGYIAQHRVSYEGPNPSPVLGGLKKAGYTQVPPGQSPGFESPLRIGKTLFGSGILQKIMRELLTLKEELANLTASPPRIGPLLKNSSSDWNSRGNWSQSDDSDADLRPKKKGGNRIGPSDFTKECVAAHNEYRARHGVRALKLSKKLSLSSLKWAQHLARKGSVRDIYHSKTKYGENIYASRGYVVTGRTPVDAWYDEIDDYDFRTGSKKEGRTGKIGHLTQLLWKDSKEMGVGVAKSRNGAIFVVCHYNPPGNVRGRYTRNVPPVGGFTEADIRRESKEDARDPYQWMF